MLSNRQEQRAVGTWPAGAGCTNSRGLPHPAAAVNAVRGRVRRELGEYFGAQNDIATVTLFADAAAWLSPPVSFISAELPQTGNKDIRNKGLQLLQ